MSRRSSYAPHGGYGRSFDWNDIPQPYLARPRVSTQLPMPRRDSIGNISTSDWPPALPSHGRQDSSYWRRNSGIPAGSGQSYDNSSSRLNSSLLNSGLPKFETDRSQVMRPRVDYGISSRSAAQNSYGANTNNLGDSAQYRRPFCMRDSIDDDPPSPSSMAQDSYDWGADFSGQESPPCEHTPRPGDYDTPYAGSARETISSGGWGNRSISSQATSGGWGDRSIASVRGHSPPPYNSRASSPGLFGSDGRSLPAPGRRHAQTHIPLWARDDDRPSSSYSSQDRPGLSERDMRFLRR